MKEMIYSMDVEKRIWLDHGEYKGYEYVIMNLGTHPTAYVGLLPTSFYFAYNGEKDLYIQAAHGGITYSQDFIIDEDKKKYMNGKWWIGWDYAHLGDYMPWYDYDFYQKKWTTEEVLEDVKAVIDEIIEMELTINESRSAESIE